MNTRRRHWLQTGLASSLASLAAVTVGRAHAQAPAWPARPIKYVVPFAPGGVSDGMALQRITQTRMRQIPYKGGSQAMVDLVGGQIDRVFETVAAARPIVDARRARVLGVTSSQHLASLPGIPTLAEAGAPRFDIQSWQGVFAPAATPKAIVERLGRELAAIVALPAMQDKLRNLGVEPGGRQTEAFGAFQRAEIAQWRKVIQDAGIQAE